MLHLQKRDLNIFILLNSIGILTSKNIKNIVSNNTKLKTLNLRLNSLKKEGYLKEINKKDRSKTDYMIYQLTSDKILLSRIYGETGYELNSIQYNLSYLLYNHQLFLGNLISYFLGKIREKNESFELDFNKIYGSKQVQQLILREQRSKENKYNYLDKIPIPDFMFENNNTLYCFELENMNSYNQFKNKMILYNDLEIYKNNENFLPLFKNRKIVLIIGCRETKKTKYEEIINENLNGIKTLIKTID
ncbi:MAG: hypothetical protein PHV23_01390 [Candidatus Gracilibacteria bacterium]|nr:hypothetical protein [Candidatus Gracilibacteria bacterium]